MITKAMLQVQKTKLDKTGFIQHLSPQKTSRGGNKYYIFQIQTSSNSAERIVCFSLTKATQMKKFAKSKSPFQISKLISDQTGTPLVDDYSVVTEAKSFDISFDYNELDVTGSKELKSYSLQEINVADVKIVELNGSLSFVTVTGYIAFDLCAMATKLTKYGPAKMREDIIMAGNNYQIFLNVWENTFVKLHTKKLYTLMHLMPRKSSSDQAVSLSTAFSTKVSEIGLDYTIP